MKISREDLFWEIKVRTNFFLKHFVLTIKHQKKDMSMMEMCKSLKSEKEIQKNYFIPPFILPNFMMYVACLWEKRINVRWLNEYLDKTINLSSDKALKEFGLNNLISAEKSINDSALSLMRGNHIKKSKNIYLFSFLILLALLILLWFIFIK